MLVAHFWAKSRLQNKLPGRQVTVTRWGWSDHSQEEAQAMADQRAREAMERVLNGEELRRQEAAWSYDGEEGLPIREEIIAQHGHAVITRNSYGSLCLNT
ncbi:MAG: hypothetical protein JNG86_06950, partial [Verrucomicrobiaceae bacterium]|nr:hypothetical protein [Verrucomicrobiaceae bacterium]